MTDGRIILLPDGEETKLFDVKDGHGIKLALRAGIKTAIITGRESFALRARAKDLEIAYLYERAHNKIEPFEEILKSEGMNDVDVCVIGDDVTDIPLLRRAGLSIVVSDCVQEARDYAHYITKNPGGRGAVREAAELILKAQDKWNALISRYTK
jgi:3-deoxy-D-manno-octulosonate 8-phosphate phosphatase (KDO 8-P phosphatase)